MSMMSHHTKKKEKNLKAQRKEQTIQMMSFQDEMKLGLQRKERKVPTHQKRRKNC